MDDAYRAGMHAGDLRRIALELERSLPSGEWWGHLPELSAPLADTRH